MNHMVKLIELDNIVNSLNVLINEKEISIKASYRLSKLYKKLIEELEQYEKNRMKLINKYGNKDLDGNLIIKDNIVELSDVQKFQFEFNELNNIEIEISFEQIDIQDFGDIKIAPKHLIVLDKFIKEN